ncbi:lipid-binding SYLF domain-containing protein [Dyadobacter luticola]|uniref:Lipid-binding SYLF domain-containing protein n=1 Tax=Dyadobacter luticola TaxID=1979387 RepID=A0A5R9L4J1_9BACT|nr:lipid-binding SYLF domain-containing protein [Dyadobacter luticola]TLV03287.1 lipid-binding SYLF domain-containing protein [Dyadobacter luticola]
MFLKNLKSTNLLIWALIFSFAAAPTFAQNKEEDKVKAATAVLNDFNEMQENIPAQLLNKSKGVIIIPKMINAGLMVGGKYGRGLAMVKNDDGEWSDPVFITIAGGSVGAQIGVQAVDLVLVFKSSKSLKEIGKGSFTLGGDVSVAAGPMGRSSSAQTDYKLEAEVYSYSRSKGLFAGITLNGAALAIDDKANRAFYSNWVNANTTFEGSANSSQPVSELRAKLEEFN